ncbi:MAG: DUF3536 domain-containing protein, partial [Fimbriimonadaceae bacterium]|nr:DUF3536 domain-containing protein [Chitinophagales bacterium]
MKKYICIHGHFYQPPRENAWTGEIDAQHSAHPYKNWNERISAECYTPMSVAKILDEHGAVKKIINNYAHISFNFGATLLSWMEKNDAYAYHKIIEADKLSCTFNNNHGNAIAQVYNHVIMPLANYHDKETQIIWGIEDFIYRFKRKPEGMWLAETAVNTETLELLVNHNIKFTILSPRQAKAFKLVEGSTWKEINDKNKLDTTQQYLCKLPSGKSIVLFFYDGALASDVAFNGALHNGKIFSEKIKNSFHTQTNKPQLIHVATDGESYGHHHRFGEMALASCINNFEHDAEIKITNYANYISLFEPFSEIQIRENSSWSCVHGVERWRSNCGCSDGANANYHQQWRAPLRNALNWLRDEAAIIFENEICKYYPDAWEVRNKYIHVMLQRNLIEEFLQTYFSGATQEKEKIIALFEMQKFSLLMFTSCAWFFDDVSRIETKQVLQYAERTIEYAESIAGKSFREKFLELLTLTPSNVSTYGN